MPPFARNAHVEAGRESQSITGLGDAFVGLAVGAEKKVDLPFTDEVTDAEVRGKTGTFSEPDRLNQSQMVTGKGLAGYFTRPDGRRFAFAVYINNVDVKGDDAVRKVVGEAVGELAAAGYLGK